MNALVKTVRTNWLKYLLWGLLFSLIIVPLAAAMIVMGIHEGDASRPHVPELRKIANETPVYPGAKNIGDKVVLKRNMTYFNTWYQSDTPFAEIRAYYERELPLRGWTLPKGPSNRFIDFDAHSRDYRHGDYFIAVERDDRSNNFSIVFIWDPQ